MKNYNVLAMDFGASSGRGIVGGFDGEKISLTELHRFENRPAMLAGRYTWDFPSLYSEILASLGKASQNGGVSSLGIDTWGVDYGYIDKNGHLLANPAHYRDLRTQDVREELFSRLPWEELYGITGIQDLSFNTVYQLYADVTKDPHIVASADKMLFMPDLFNYFLTGELATEYTIASTGAILDAEKREISRTILERIGIPESMFTPVKQPSTYLGKLLPEVKDASGSTDLDVINVASHDTASAVIAVPAEGDDFVYISSGTWSLLGTEMRSPVITSESRKYGFTNEGGADGTVRVLKNIAGLWLSQESRRQWMREGVKYSFDELASMANSAEPRKFLINPDDELFTPAGNMPRRIADYCEKTGQGRPETPGQIIRCIFDSLALRYRWGILKINEIRGTKAGSINIVGGGTKEKDLCRLAADACGIPVYAGPTEATALGNISSQLIASGQLAGVSEARAAIRASFPLTEYLPDTSERDAWDEAYGRFLSLVETK